MTFIKVLFKMIQNKTNRFNYGEKLCFYGHMFLSCVKFYRWNLVLLKSDETEKSYEVTLFSVIQGRSVKDYI